MGCLWSIKRVYKLRHLYYREPLRDMRGILASQVAKMNVPRLALLLLFVFTLPAVADDGNKWIQDLENPLISTFTDNSSGFAIELQATKPDISCDIVWSRIYGGPEDEYVTSFSETSDGGYIITGLTQSYGSGNTDLWLLRTDSNGIELWNRTLKGQGQDRGFSVVESKDGGFIIAGSEAPEESNGGFEGIWLIKTDSNGNKIWDKAFAGRPSDWKAMYGESEFMPPTSSPREVTGTSALEGSDGDIMLLANTRSQGARLIKADSSGEELWNKTLCDTRRNEAYSIIQADDGGYVLTGYFESPGLAGKDLWLEKVDTLGNELWNRTFSRSWENVGYSINQANDGGYIIAGSTGFDAWLIKTNNFGIEQWNKTFSEKKETKGLSALPAGDGGFLLAGYTGEEAGVWIGESDIREFVGDAYLVKVDAAGNTECTLILSRSNDKAYAIRETEAGKFIVVGVTELSWEDRRLTKEYLEWWLGSKETSFLGLAFEPGYRGWDAWMMSIVYA
jgi:hypothetical protein